MYVLKSKKPQDGQFIYFMNVICVTPQPEFAEHYRTREEAEKHLQSFNNLLYDDEGEIIEYNNN